MRIRQALGEKLGLAESLESFALLASRLGRLELTVLLSRAATALRETIGAPRLPAEQKRYEDVLAVACDQLGDIDGVGVITMTPEEAVTLALSNTCQET